MTRTPREYGRCPGNTLNSTNTATLARVVLRTMVRRSESVAYSIRSAIVAGQGEDEGLGHDHGGDGPLEVQPGRRVGGQVEADEIGEGVGRGEEGGVQERHHQALVPFGHGRFTAGPRR